MVEKTVVSLITRYSKFVVRLLLLKDDVLTKRPLGAPDETSSDAPTSRSAVSSTQDLNRPGNLSSLPVPPFFFL